MKKRVLILGSKPGAVIDEFDVAYCANSSGFLYRDQLVNRGDNLNTIVAASELMSTPSRNSNEKKLWQQERINAIKSLTNHNLKIVSSEFFPEIIRDMADFRDYKSLELLPHRKYEDFIKSLGCLYPIITPDHIHLDGSILKETLRYFLELLKYKCRYQYLVNPLYRQGTGLICLIEAIMCHGQDASYKIAGIGFDDRNLYEGGGINTWTPHSKINKNHVFADKKLIKHLSNLYEINCR